MTYLQIGNRGWTGWAATGIAIAIIAVVVSVVGIVLGLVLCSVAAS